MTTDHAEQVTYFAETDARGRRRAFGIKAVDRTKHVYVIGKTGMGKSTLLENMAVQDIRNGEGFAFVDPHGATASKLLDYIPPERVDDVLYFAPFDMDHPVSFNIMEDVGYDKRHLVVSGLMSAFKKIWVDAWSARMEYILGNTLLALLEYPETTLLDVNRMLVEKAFRKKVVAAITDPLVKAFWEEEFANYTDRYTQDATPAIQNKIGQFTSNPLIRNIVGQAHSTFDLREMMDDRKIVIANLSKGQMGEGNANLLGSMLITKIYLAAMSRADVSDETIKALPNFYFYVDEFQSFANESFADILSEARKYKLNLTMAHQYIEQMSEEVRAAVFGNVGTMIAFRVGAFDAEVLEKEFAPEFTAQDLVNLGFAQVYLKLMIDGVSSPPFSATTLPPLEPPSSSGRDVVVARSRDKYARERAPVEDDIRDRNRDRVQVAAPENKPKERTAHQEVRASAPPKEEKREEYRPPQQKAKAESGEAPRQKKRPQEMASLSQLKKGGEKGTAGQKKGDGDKERAELRDALASVLATQNKPATADDNMQERREEQQEERQPPREHPSSGQAAPADRKPRPAVPPAAPQSSEVPEDVLRSMLTLDEDERKA